LLCVWIGSEDFMQEMLVNPKRIQRHSFLKDRLRTSL